MALRNIVKDGDPILEKRCRPVEKFDAKLHTLLDDMAETMHHSGEQEGNEGCLSFPGQWGIVKRPEYVKVKAQNRFGEEFEAEGKGLLARAFCHEIDHLNGIVFKEVAERMLTKKEINQMNV